MCANIIGYMCAVLGKRSSKSINSMMPYGSQHIVNNAYDAKSPLAMRNEDLNSLCCFLVRDWTRDLASTANAKIL